MLRPSLRLHPAWPSPSLRLWTAKQVNRDVGQHRARCVGPLTALIKNAVMLADNGSAWYLSGVPDERRHNDAMHQRHQVPGWTFQAVDGSGLMVDSDFGKARQLGAWSTCRL